MDSLIATLKSYGPIYLIGIHIPSALLGYWLVTVYYHLKFRRTGSYMHFLTPSRKGDFFWLSAAFAPLVLVLAFCGVCREQCLRDD